MDVVPLSVVGEGQAESTLRLLIDLLERVSQASTLVDVNIAAGIALEALMRSV